MQSNFLHFRKGQIHYLQFGIGPELLIALYGFAGISRVFRRRNEKRFLTAFLV